MRRCTTITIALATAMALGPIAPAAQADHDGLHLPLTDLLPAMAEDEPAKDVDGRCGGDGLKCLNRVEKHLARHADRFGCDHRAVFATTYQLLTHETVLQMQDDPGAYDDPAGLGLEAVYFYELYRDMLKDQAAGNEIPPAWQVAMEVAASGDYTAGHDMLLGINAHVQRDMPFAIARAGITLPDGTTRKGDHDRFNEVLSRAYDTIVPTIAERFDPFMALVDDGGLVLDDIGSMELVAMWREGVWRNAERIVQAGDDPAALADVVASIELNAELWARFIQSVPAPGWGGIRDPYCAGASLQRTAVLRLLG